LPELYVYIFILIISLFMCHAFHINQSTLKLPLLIIICDIKDILNKD